MAHNSFDISEALDGPELPSSLPLKTVLVALGCDEGVCHHANDYRPRGHTLHGDDAVMVLRRISAQPGPFVHRPWTVLDLACSDPQALDYACSDPWLRLCLVLAIVEGTTHYEDEAYGEYCETARQVLGATNYQDEALRRREISSGGVGGQMYWTMLCAASLMRTHADALRALEQWSESIGEIFEEFVHAALGAMGAMSFVVADGASRDEVRRRILHRLCVDIHAVEVHTHVRYDPHEGYDWSGTAEDELPLAIRVVSAYHEDCVWQWIEFFAALYDSEIGCLRHLKDFDQEHIDRLMALAAKLSGRP